MTKHNYGNNPPPLRDGAPPMPPVDPTYQQRLPRDAVLGDHPATPRPPIPQRPRQPGAAEPFDAMKDRRA
jgi:hypothetical protein